MALPVVIWRGGAPDSAEGLYAVAESLTQPCARPEGPADQSTVFECELFDMRVGDRGRKRRRIIAAQATELLGSKASAGTLKARPGKAQSKLRTQAPGAIPSNWTLSARNKPGNKSAGAPAEVRLSYHAPTGEVFKSYSKAKKFWVANGQRALRRDSKAWMADEDGLGSAPQNLTDLPEGWTTQTKTHSNNHSKAGQTYTVFQAPTGEKFTSLQQAKQFCIQSVTHSKHGHHGGLQARAPVSLPDLCRELHRLAGGEDVRGGDQRIQAALLRARRARCVKRANRLTGK